MWMKVSFGAHTFDSEAADILSTKNIWFYGCNVYLTTRKIEKRLLMTVQIREL